MDEDTDVNRLRADWTEPTEVRFGVGRVSELAGACADLGIEKPLFVTDPGLAGLGIFRQAVAACAAQGLSPQVFSETRKNPTLAHAELAYAAWRDGGHDGIIAFGGGTPIDTAKVMALLAGEKRSPWDFEVVAGTAHSPPPRPCAKLPPIIAVPTTAGSGAELRPFAAVIDAEHRRRRVLRHPGMLPDIVIIDPVLTIDLPPNLTAATGMNAFAHNLEAFCTPGFDPAAEGMAAEGVRLARVYLPRAFRNANDLVARSKMMASAALGGMVFRRGLGAIQAMTDPIAAVSDAHHGLASGVLTPYVLAYNRPVVEKRMARLAAYVGLDDPDFTSFMRCVIAIREEVGIPHTLRGLGISGDAVERLAADALRDPFAADNPLPLKAADLVRIYGDAMEGRLD